MSVSDAIDELLVRWQELRRRGESPSVPELCGDHPSLADELNRRINAFESMEAMLGIGPQGTLPAASRSHAVPAHLAEKLLPLGYALLEVIDQGGMGVVYKATQIELRRTVALKMIAGLRVGPKQLARFRTEAEAVARLQHPHIVQIYEVGEVDGHSYFSMEYVEGGTLAHRMESGPLPPATAAELVEVLARAVHHAHTRGIVHRDLKPANILLHVEGRKIEESVAPDLTPLLTEELRPKLTDFGLAKRLGADAGHTTTGEVIGTPAYMAPEQARGETNAIGTACDVYALGAILYEALTGSAPFRGGSVLETLRQVISDEPVPPRVARPGVPRDLDAICLKCLEKKPSHRYASAAALADDLGRFAKGLPVAARRGARPARFLKWTRRRRIPLAALSLMVIAACAIVARGYADRKRQVGEQEQLRVRVVEQEEQRRARAVEVAPQAREILRRHCYSCHGETEAKRKFRVFDRASLLDVERKNVIPDDPEHSRLIQRIEDGSMPPENDKDSPEKPWLPRVPEEELSVLKEWIAGGAPEFPPEDPRNPTPPVVPHSQLAADVYVIFRARCLMCHTGPEAKGAIKILNHNLLRQRKVMVPGKPEDSELYRLLKPEAGQLKMPPTEDDDGQPVDPLTDSEVEKIRQWIAAGAPPFPHAPRKK